MGYWENRQAKEMYEAMESAEEAAKEIADVYAMASKELNYKIAQTYEKYRDKYNLSDEEAKKLLNAMRDPSDIEELKMKLKGLKRPEADEILKELESPAYRARIERYENLQSEIDKMMKDVYKQEKKINTNHYVDQYNDSYYREIYDLQKRTGLDFSFGNVDPKELDRILHSNWSGENYSQRIWGNTEKLAQDVKQQLALAYLTGKNESDIAAEIARLYATGAAYARRLIRTESAYISGQAQAAADEEAGIDSYRILATLDLRTSEICREMDGKVFEYKDMQVGVNFPPFHPYCRTTVLSEIDDQDLSQLKRRSRDPVTGEVKTFPGDITYQKWYEKEVAHNPEALFAEQVEKHRGADLKQYERYVERLGKKKVGSIDDFREKKYKTPELYEQLKELYKNPEQAAGLRKTGKDGIIDAPKRKQIDTGYKGEIPDEKLDEYNKKALEQIKADTGLSDEDAKALHDAMMEYFGGDYESILDGKNGTDEIIRAGISKMPKYDGPIYRGLCFQDGIGDFADLKVGDTIPEKGIISSWSSNKRVADSFAGTNQFGNAVILECEDNISGAGVQHISKKGTREAEVLSSAKYEVVEIVKQSKYEYLSEHKELLMFPDDLVENEIEFKEMVVCKIKVKEKS